MRTLLKNATFLVVAAACTKGMSALYTSWALGMVRTGQLDVSGATLGGFLVGGGMFVLVYGGLLLAFKKRRAA